MVVARIGWYNQGVPCLACEPRDMRTHMDVLARQAPGLPESLRTLVVSPERELEPGATLRATFTFRNHGSAPATGVRVRFLMQNALLYEGAEPDFFSDDGAPVGDLEPGMERCVELPFRLAETAESNSEIALQAAVTALGVPAIGSNVARWVVQRHPEIRAHVRRNGSQLVSSGDHVECTIAIVNDGRIPATHAVVHLRIGNGLEDASIFEKREQLSFADSAVDIGIIQPEIERRFCVRARVRLPFYHHDTLTITATLQCRELPAVQLGDVSWCIAPQANFSPALTHYDRNVADLDVAVKAAMPRVVRFLNETRFPGLVRHLFALRVLLPEDTEWGKTRDQLDRLFIKLRLPNYEITERDIETSPRFWLEKTMLLGNENMEFQLYRTALIDTFMAVENADLPAFRSKLQNGEFATLDAALDAICDRLYR